MVEEVGEQRHHAIGAVDEASSALGINGDASDNSAPSAGAVYIMRQGPSSWSQEAFIKASNTEAGDDYGHAVALTADGNLVLAGASLECASSTGVNGNQLNNDEPESGAAYLWRRVGSVWGQ